MLLLLILHSRHTPVACLSKLTPRALYVRRNNLSTKLEYRWTKLISISCVRPNFFRGYYFCHCHLKFSFNLADCCLNLEVLSLQEHIYVENMGNNVDVDDGRTENNADNVYDGHIDRHEDARNWSDVVSRGSVGGRNVRIFTARMAYRKNIKRTSRKIIILS